MNRAARARPPTGLVLAGTALVARLARAREADEAGDHERAGAGLGDHREAESGIDEITGWVATAARGCRERSDGPIPAAGPRFPKLSMLASIHSSTFPPWSKVP